jgi:hypothetical protein
MSNKIRVITNTDPALGETVLNCNPNLIHYCIPTHDPLWHDFRTVGALGYDGGIGASECHKFLRVEKEDYRPVLPEIIEWKAGISKPKPRLTKAMMAGILMEAVILEMWKYYDGLPDTYPDNYLARSPKREYGRVGAYIVNKTMPWLFVSLDAYVKAGYSNLYGQVLNEHCPLECKTVGFQAAKAQEHGIPIYYVYQIQQQMLVTETDYAELAILEGGNLLKVEAFQASQIIQEEILEKTYHHWQIVLKMREMKAEKDQLSAAGKYGEAERVDSHIQSLLPLPSSGEGYNEYYNDKHAGKEVVKGDMTLYKEIRKRAILKQVIKILDEKAELTDNLCRDFFVRNQAEVIDFDNLGSVKYVRRANGVNKFPDFKSMKEKPNPRKIQAIIDSILKETL